MRDPNYVTGVDNTAQLRPEQLRPAHRAWRTRLQLAGHKITHPAHYSKVQGRWHLAFHCATCGMITCLSCAPGVRPCRGHR